MPTSPPIAINTDYSFSALTPAEQNALLWQHNRWLLDQLTQAEHTIEELQTQKKVLTQLAHSNDFYDRFNGDINRNRDFTIQALRKLKKLYESNPVIADLAADELIDAVKDMGRQLQAEAKQRLGIDHKRADKPDDPQTH